MLIKSGAVDGHSSIFTGSDGPEGIMARKMTGPAPAMPQLAAGARLVVLGDSGFARGDVFTANAWEHKAAAMHHWATALTAQRARNITWYDATATAANLVPAYADASATDPLNRGGNFGFSGDTATGTLKRINQLVDTGAEILWYRSGSNVGSTDALASTTISAIQTAIQNARARAGALRRIVLETILPRKVSLTPTGFELDTAQMARILTINDAIRANYAAWGADVLCDCWEDIRDTQYSVGHALYGTGLPENFISDGAHPSITGAYRIGLKYKAIIDQLVSAGRWYPQNSGGIFTNWNLTGSSGTVGASCSGQMPASMSILNTAGALQPVTAACALSSLSETGGQLLTITITSTGAGAPNNYQEIRIANSNMTSGFTSTDWWQFIPDFEVDSPGFFGLIQCVTGDSSNITTVFSRGLGQMGLTQGSAANEYWPSGSFVVEPDTAPMQVGAKTSLISRMSMMIRSDIAQTVTVRLKRWRMPIVQDPTITLPWIP